MLQTVDELAVIIDDRTILDVVGDDHRSQQTDASEIVGEPIDEVFPDERAHALAQDIERARETGIEEFDYEVPTQVGSADFSGHVTPIHPDEAHSAVVWVAKDVTEHNRRTENHRIHEYALESSLSGIAIANRNGDLLSANRAFLDLWGYDEEDEILGTSVTSHWKQPDAAAVTKTLKEDDHWNGTLTAVRSDGSTFPAECAASMVTDEDGTRIAMMLSFVDISERRDAQATIRRKNDLLQRTEQLAAVGGWELDLETETLTWTDGTRRIHGVGDEYEPTQREAVEFYHPQDRDEIRRAVQQCREDDTPYDLEARIITANGRTRWVRTNGKRITRGGRASLQGAIRDVTARKNREQRLMVMYRVLRHNLRNALNVVTGHAGHIRRELETLLYHGRTDDDRPVESILEDLKRGTDDAERERSDRTLIEELGERFASFSGESVREDVRKIEQTTAELLDVVEKTREFERSYDGDGTSVAVSTRAILEDITQVYEERHPEVSIEVVGPDVTVQARAGQLYSVIEELLENAIEHADREQPSVTLRIEIEQQPIEAVTGTRRVLISVEDTGPGIPVQERDAIERGVETPLVHATGLGLWQVNWLVTQLGGTLTFEDNDPQGTIVTVELPASPDDGQ